MIRWDHPQPKGDGPVETYNRAAAKARRIMRDGGDQETLRLAVGTAIEASPTDEDRRYWQNVAKALADGLTVRTKETIDS